MGTRLADPFTIGLFAVLIVGAMLATFKIMGRASKGYEKARARRAAGGPAIPCSTCGSSMEYAGVNEFKVAPGPLSADTDSLPLEVHRCPTCRKVEMFLPPAAG
ncbi:MAG TPA: hypothetical protein VI541_01270 [Actinomycetota bacterium]|nr:hypothetical protein [Actinomycetota bacterium]